MEGYDLRHEKGNTKSKRPKPPEAQFFYEFRAGFDILRILIPLPNESRHHGRPQTSNRQTVGYTRIAVGGRCHRFSARRVDEAMDHSTARSLRGKCAAN